MSFQPYAPEPGDPSDAELRIGAAERRDDDAEVAERAHVERATTSWSELLGGAIGSEVEIGTCDGLCHRGILVDVGAGWCVIEVGGRAHLLPLTQVVTVSGLGGTAPSSATRAGIGSPLRHWGRIQSRVCVQLIDGSNRNGQVVDVLADAFTLAPENASAKSETFPYSALLWAVGDLFSG